MQKMLMITTQEIIDDISDGGKRVSNRNYNFLCDTFGKERILLMMCTNHVAEDTEAIRRIKSYSNKLFRLVNLFWGRITMTKRGEREVLRTIKDESVGIVFLDRTIQGRMAHLIKQYYPEVKIWSFCHNIESDYFYNRFKNNKLFAFAMRRIIERSETIHILESSRMFVLTSRDSNQIYEKYGKKSFILPTTFVDYFDLNNVGDFDCCLKEKRLLFVGSMFGPNYDGILWFVNNVMSQLPQCRLTIVGKDFEKKRDELSRKNVDVVGSVANLEKYYYEPSIMVMPIFYGDGQKVKTAEAMMYGKIIIASNEALVGYDVDGVKGIFRCNNCEEYVNIINSITEADMKDALESVRRAFLSQCSYSAVLDRVAPLMREWV